MNICLQDSKAVEFFHFYASNIKNMMQDLVSPSAEGFGIGFKVNMYLNIWYLAKNSIKKRSIIAEKNHNFINLIFFRWVQFKTIEPLIVSIIIVICDALFQSSDCFLYTFGNF